VEPYKPAIAEHPRSGFLLSFVTWPIFRPARIFRLALEMQRIGAFRERFLPVATEGSFGATSS
jgi:hypothetical protein